MRKDYGKNTACSNCGEMFNYLGVASHRAGCREKHFICPTCNKRFKLKEEIEYHIEAKHLNKD